MRGESHVCRNIYYTAHNNGRFNFILFFPTFMIVTHDQNDDAFQLITTMSFIFYSNIIIYVGTEYTL